MTRRTLTSPGRLLGLLVLPFVLASCAGTDDTATSPDTASALAEPGALAVAQEAPVVEGRVLARFQPGAAAADIASAAGASIERPLVLGIQVLSVPAGAERRIAAALARNPNVDFAEPDYVRTFGDPAVMPANDSYIGYKWDLDNDGSIYSSTGDVLASTGAANADMDWREAVESLASASGTARIGIMDTGIRNDHEEFQGRIAVQHDFFAGDSNAEDDDGHGSHVAGIAAAATGNGAGVAGVAYTGTVELVIAKVCGQINPGPFGYGCPTSAIADGIVFAVDNGAHVLNLSLGGGGGSETTRAALQHARSNNVLPICAAGNDGGPVSYPGAWPECVAVSATDWSDGLASYSNFGPEVELSAAGGDDEHPDGYSLILSAYNGGPSSYAFIAGTSMASPQVAGLGALLHVLGVADDGDKLARMKSSADDLGAAGTDDLYGVGRINVHNAVNGLGGGDGGTTNSPPTASFTHACTDLTCDFDGSGSTDSDGTVASYAWDFGDGATASGATVSHSYGQGGDYTVVLTVTDDGGATDSASGTVSVTEPSTGGIGLSATGYKVKGLHKADLTWSGATSTSVDVYRDGSVVATTPNDGAYTDNIDQRGGATYSYVVCEAGTSTCSNEATVTF